MPETPHSSNFGITIMVLSAFLFAMLYLFSDWMSPLSGTVVFAWRMLGMFVSLLILLQLGDKWRDMLGFLKSLLASPSKGLMMIMTTPIIASQLWLFMWAGVNGHAVDVSVGYLIFPLFMVAGGWLFLRESITRLQCLALALACIGVLYQVWYTQAFSWATVWVFLTYPVYYLSRRYFSIPALLGLTFDLAVIAPCALVYLLLAGDFLILAEPSKFWLLIPLLGLISAWAMQFNLNASVLLPVPLFGMLSYVEPILLFVLSVTLLGETISLSTAVSLGFICFGLLVSLMDNWIKLKNNA